MGFFGESFDNYSVRQGLTDALSYWDSTIQASAAASDVHVLATGRYQGYSLISSNTNGALLLLRKDSGSNDATHHFWVSYKQDGTFLAATQGFYVSLRDNTSFQCSVVFKSTGDILLNSGNALGATLSTYTAAIADNNWHSFEIEVTVNNTTGTFKVRKDGDVVDTHSATGLNTRAGTVNNYANNIQFSQIANVNAANPQYVDDFLWEYGATPGAWRGEMRCYPLPPVSDASKLFTASPNPDHIHWVDLSGSNSTSVRGTGSAHYASFVPLFTGTISTFTFEVNASVTANIRAAIYSSSAGSPALSLGSGTLANPVSTNPNVITFSPGVAVVKGTTYFLAVNQDAGVTYLVSTGAQGTVYLGTTAYASFPASNPGSLSTTTSTWRSYSAGLLNTPSGINAQYVNDPGQIGILNNQNTNFNTGFVMDDTVADFDYYNADDMTVTPTSIVSVVLRSSVTKSNSGVRQYKSRVKSGATVASGSIITLTSAIKHVSQVMLVDPNTSLPWTVTAINSLQIGPYVEA